MRSYVIHTYTRTYRRPTRMAVLNILQYNFTVLRLNDGKTKETKDRAVPITKNFKSQL